MCKKAFRIIQAAAVLPVLLCISLRVQAQIYFVNPIFNCDSTGAGVIPNGWHIFEHPGGTFPADGYNGYLHFIESDCGKTYVVICCQGLINAFDTGYKEGFYQTLTCTLYKGNQYHFTFYASGLPIEWNPPGNKHSSGINIWLNDQYLHKTQLIDRICSIDTGQWTKFEVDFIPDFNSNIISFESYRYCNYDFQYGNCVAIDCLSPITFQTKDYISASVSDSIVNDIKPVKLSCTIMADSPVNYTYSWRSVPPGFSSTAQNPVATPLQTTSYFVTAHYTCGMDLTDSVKVRVNVTSLWFPTAFTPNHDGKDDLFGGFCTLPDLVTSYKLQIYNRWGQLIFTANSVTKKWDGTFNGQPVPQGTYMYNCTYTLSGATYQKSGDVELIR
jgi:gliding motility-associated-like protein